MLSGEGNAGERWKTTKVQLAKKATSHVQHTFLYISLPLFCTITTWNFQKLLSHKFYGGNVVCVLVHFFFSLPLIFTLHWWPLSFPILSLPLQNFHVVLPTKKNVSFVFHLSLKISAGLFNLVELRWPAAYFVFFSVFLLLYIPNLWKWQLI